VWDSTISMSFDRYLERGKVTGARKTQSTLSVTLAFTFPIEQVPEGEDVAHDRMAKMAAEWQQMEAGIHMKRVRRGAQRESGRSL
jgi:hypothetical protein